MQLSATQLESLQREGFLRVPEFTTEAQVGALRSILERLFEKRAGEKEGAYGELATRKDYVPNSPQIMLPVNYAPELHKTACFQSALLLAKQILGDDAHFVSDLAIMKRPLDGDATPWHQDLAFRDPRFVYQEVTIWVALQDTDERSGCLKFLPGTHTGAVLTHSRTDPSGKSVALQCVEAFDRARTIASILPSGGCTIHFPGILHCSTPNVSENARIAYIMTFGRDVVPAPGGPVAFAWRDEVETVMEKQRRQWMWRGGFLITAWRRLRRGELRSWGSIIYWVRRSMRTLVKGG